MTPAMNTLALRDVQAERARQDRRWGGPEHDDQHTATEWLDLISAEWNEAWGAINDQRGEFRHRMVRIAALAVAAAEVVDRQASDEIAAALTKGRRGAMDERATRSEGLALARADKDAALRDRTVHGKLADGVGEIVRYDRAGKWYVEWPDSPTAEMFMRQRDEAVAQLERATGWHDAGRSAFWAFERLCESKTLTAQGEALRDLQNAMADLVTWLPGWDYETGELGDPADA